MDFSRVQYAIQQDDKGTISQWLADSAVDINSDVDGQFGSTALHWACHYDKYDIAQLLLSKAANPNVGNAYKATPLHWACKTGSSNLVQLLVAHKGDVTLKTINNDTPMDIATQIGVTEVVNILLGKSPEKCSTVQLPPQNQPRAPLQLDVARVDTTSHNDSLAVSPKSSRSATSVGYSMSVLSGSGATGTAVATASGHSHSAMQALQRSKVRAEMDYKISQKMVETLQKECNDLQLEKLQLLAKVQASGEMTIKLEEAQKEKIRLEIALKQAEAEKSLQQRTQTTNAEPAAREQQETLTTLLKEKKQAIEESHRLKEKLQALRNSAAQEAANKDATIDDLHASVNQLQVDKVRTEMQLREYAELKSVVSELQKDKALVELELAGKAELERQLDLLQTEKFNVQKEMRDAQNKSEELQQVIGGLKKQVAMLEGEMEEFQDVKRALEQEKREKAKLEIHAQTLTEELGDRKELALNAIRGTEDAVGSLQNNLEALRQEKTKLKQELQQEREEGTKLNQALLELNQKVETQTSITQEVEILKTTLKAAETEKSTYEKSLADLEVKHQELSKQCAEMQKEKVVTDVELEDLRKFKVQFQKMEEENLTTAMQLKQATLTAETTQQNYDRLLGEQQFMQEQVRLLEDVRDAYTKLEKDFAVAEEKLRQQQVEMDKLTGDRNYWETQWNLAHSKEKADMQQQLLAAENETRRLQCEMKAVVDQLVQAQSTIANLTDTRVAMEASTIEQLRQKVTELQNSKAALEAQTLQHQQAQQQLQAFARTQDQIEAKDAEIKDLNTVVNDLKTRLKTVQDTLASERRQNQAQVEQLKHQFATEEHRIRQSAQQELEQLQMAFQQEADGLQQRSAIMDKERQALEMQIKALQEQASFAVVNATKRPLLEPAGFKSKLEHNRLLDAPTSFSPADLRLTQTHSAPKTGSGGLLAELADLRASSTLPPLLSSATPSSTTPERKLLQRPGAFAREQRALLRGKNNF